MLATCNGFTVIGQNTNFCGNLPFVCLHYLIIRCVKMFPPKTRTDVGMVQCVAEGHGKPPGRKTVGTRRRAGSCKEEGQPVHAKPRSLTFADFDYIQCTIPTSGNILRCLRSCYHPLFLHLHIVMQL